MRSWLRRNEGNIALSVGIMIGMGLGLYRMYLIATSSVPYGFNPPPNKNLMLATDPRR